MDNDQLNKILSEIKKVNVAVYGDFCIDAYWLLDPRGSEISVETGLKAQAVGSHYYSLGGASNIVANLAALGPANISVIGVIGPDIFGRELKLQLENLGVDTSFLIVQNKDYDTVTFGKRYLEGSEKSRIDFGVFNKRNEQTDEQLLEGISNALQTKDVLIFNQQVPGSITNERFIEQANGLFEKYNEKIVLFDSRHYGKRFKNVYRKTNAVEAALLNNIDTTPESIISLPDLKNYAMKLFAQSAKPVFVTRGERGILVADSEGLSEIPGIQLLKKTDPVGAGDTTISALALCLACGFKPAEAAQFAALAASVTVQKLFRTGTANAEEIIEINKDADFIYQPELAEDIRQARFIENSEIEFCYDPESIPFGQIKHAVFDHDGTISTLRQGWENIMAPVMIKAILGDRYESAGETLYHRVRSRVLNYIEKSTGIQTILQMQELVEMVTEFEIVPKDKVLDKYEYKKIYNDALMQLVNRRIEKFHTGQLDISDFTIKGSVEILNRLKEKGVKLYLASGTDHEDVVNEAKALGYANLFEDRIYGSVGDISKYSKKMVIEQIMKENNLHGQELVVFGDGPVEIRECRKRNGIAVGLASDEIRRHGLNIEKRPRLIKAGAQIIIPDFSQLQKLLALLFLQ